MKRVKNRKKICIVPNCMKRSTFGNELSFHSFPRRGASFVEITTKLGIKKKVDRHLEWLKRLRILNHRPDMFVCSQHFAPTDYYLPHIPVKTRVLKSTAVPSSNLPESSIERKVSTITEERSLQRIDRRRRRQKQTLQDNKKITKILDGDEIDVPVASAPFAKSLLAKSPNETIIDFEDRLLPLHESCNLGHSEELKKALLEGSKRVFVSSIINTRLGHNNIFITSLLQSDEALTTMCGIQSHAVLKNIIVLMMKYCTESESLLSPKERIILTMMKLRTNSTFTMLALIFKCPDVLACYRIFINTLIKLSRIMRSVLQWPPNKEIHQNVPKCFRSFEKTVIVLDCLKINLEKPNCSQCRTKTWSTEKSDFTAKFMTGITPAGSLIFVSDIYGGRISDTNLFKQSDVINRLNRGDAIMVDDEFKIEAICKKSGVQLFRTLNPKIQLSRRELLFNCKLAAARIHIDQINRSIYKFAILRHRISKVLIPCLQDIVVVCCAFVSLSTPELSSHDITWLL